MMKQLQILVKIFFELTLVNYVKSFLIINLYKKIMQNNFVTLAVKLIHIGG